MLTSWFASSHILSLTERPAEIVVIANKYDYLGELGGLFASHAPKLVYNETAAMRFDKEETLCVGVGSILLGFSACVALY
ncbi:MAG: hypothetical protein KatS3mg016_1840 [Fimbriimonadales bacterium]|nr:MAG: hypothetical protein KatS3mg016_1840 [Fimbriimonadales bacterium]